MNSSNIQQRRVLEGLPVAPLNANPSWPAGYFEVLAEAGVLERQHSFYAHWVRQFFNRHPGRSRRSLGVREIASFLRDLKSDSSMEPWQFEQARMALILYYEQFRGIALGDLRVLDALAEEGVAASSVAVKTEAASARRIPQPREVETLSRVPGPAKKAASGRRWVSRGK